MDDFIVRLFENSPIHKYIVKVSFIETYRLLNKLKRNLSIKKY